MMIKVVQLRADGLTICRFWADIFSGEKMHNNARLRVHVYVGTCSIMCACTYLLVLACWWAEKRLF